MTIQISDDDAKYLEFLKKQQRITSIEGALKAALFFLKKLNLHEWIPGKYVIGTRRVLIVPITAMLDLMHLLSLEDVYLAGKMTALKWKSLDPMLVGVDFKEPENWDIILKDLEVIGWGRFTRSGLEIKIEECPLPITYIKGYLETCFNRKFREHEVKVKNLRVLIASGEA